MLRCRRSDGTRRSSCRWARPRSLAVSPWPAALRRATAPAIIAAGSSPARRSPASPASSSRGWAATTCARTRSDSSFVSRAAIRVLAASAPNQGAETTTFQFISNNPPTSQEASGGVSEKATPNDVTIQAIVQLRGGWCCFLYPISILLAHLDVQQ